VTSIRNQLAAALAVGERFRLPLERRGDPPVAAPPSEASSRDIAVVDGLDLLHERPPSEPVEIEILGRIVDDRVAGRVVSSADGN
jgi:hypothetical protein